MENQEINNNLNTTVSQPPVQPVTESPKPSFLKSKWLVIGVLIVIMIILLGGGFLLGKNLNNPAAKACTQEAKICPDGSGVGRTGPNCEFAKCPSRDQAGNPNLTPGEPKKTEDPVTANWKIVKINTIGMEFKLPEKLLQYGTPLEKVLPGETGTFICVMPENQYPTISPGGRMNGCFSSIYALAGNSDNYTEGRGGSFMDHRGFTKKNGKYYVRYVQNSESEIKSDLVKVVPNENGVEIIKVEGKNYTYENNDWPETGSPGDGAFGAHINTRNSNYQGIAFKIGSSIITEEEFDQILSTFRFY